jgi:hypothetical protein
LPQQEVQVVLAVATAGPIGVPVATTDPTTLRSTFENGPLVEAGGLTCQAGGTVVAIRLETISHGGATAVVPTIPGSSTSVVTVSLDGTNGAFDEYYVRVKCATGGTIGATGIVLQFSLDAGRHFGPLIPLRTASEYEIPNTGVTVEFGAGTLVAGDYWSFSTSAPTWDVGGVADAFEALRASPYGLAGWGSAHLVGVLASGDVAAVQTELEELEEHFIFSRLITSSRDAAAPTAWGGSGETESAWMTSITTAYSAVDADRVCVGAGYYNMPSPYRNAVAGSPSFRRPLAWADAVRRVGVPPQRRGGRVRDGSLTNISVDAGSDPLDGFIYHDERVNPGLDAARFLAAMTWAKKQGFYVCHENLMAASGSQFTELVIGNVIDIACDIAYETGLDEISDDLRTKDNGTLYETDATILQDAFDLALKTNMTDVAMITRGFTSVSRVANVLSTKKIPVTVTIVPRVYVDEVNITLNLGVGA